MSGFDPNKLQ
jgi:hypothetical protein